MHPAKVAKAQLVECQTLDQWILCKTFHKCLGYTLNFNMFPNYLIFCFTKQVHSSSSTEHALNTFCRKKKNASVGCIYIYFQNYALRQIMGVTGHRHGCQHCFLCMQYVASC